jgi:hypothetical protein
LEVKTGLAVLVVLLTVAHSVAGRRSGPRKAMLTSRVLSSLILLGTLAIFGFAVRLAAS